jgi:hypothetical protein
MQIDKHDVIILDFLIDKMLESDDPLESNVLTKNGFLNEFTENDIEYEFTRLISIIDSLGKGKKQTYSTIGDTIERNENTLKFKESGGFQKYYQDQLLNLANKNQREQLETDLAKSNIEANELNKENARKNKYLTWINIAIGVLNLVLLGLQIFKK